MRQVGKGDYVHYRGFHDVVLLVKSLKFNGGNPICELDIFGATSEEKLRHWQRTNGYAKNTRYYTAYLHELEPANELLVIAMAANDCS